MRRAWDLATGLVRTRRIELAIFLLGVLLRVSMALSYQVIAGYDFLEHWGFVQLLGESWELPPREANRATYHGPLSYYVYALLHTSGVSAQGCAWFSVACGIGRLTLIWHALARWLPDSSRSRAWALWIAATLPASLHLEGMISNEPLLNLLSMATLVVAGRLLEPKRSLPGRLGWGIGMGILVGAGLLTKVSFGVLLVVLVPVALWDAGGFARRSVRFGDHSLRRTSARFFVRRLAPWIVAGSLSFALSGWWFMDGIERYGTPAPSAFDLSYKELKLESQAQPVWSRRPPMYAFGWSPSIHAWPFPPSGVESLDRSRFWPVLIASTFVDYWNHTFFPIETADEPHVKANARIMPTAAVPLSIVAVNAGIIVSAVTAIACFMGLFRSARRRDRFFVCMLLVPMVAVLGQLFFAIKYPLDQVGVVKSVYVQFAAAPLCAVFGIAVGSGLSPGAPWWRRYVSVIAAMASVAASAYPLGARLVAPLLP